MYRELVQKYLCSFCSILFACFVCIDVSMSGQVTYEDDPYSEDQVLDHRDLNAKFNQIKSAVNDNDAKTTLDKIDFCSHGEILVWNFPDWRCSEQEAGSAIEFEQLGVSDLVIPSGANAAIQSIEVDIHRTGFVLVSFSANYKIIHTPGPSGNFSSLQIAILTDSESAAEDLSTFPSHRTVYFDQNMAVDDPLGMSDSIEFQGTITTSIIRPVDIFSTPSDVYTVYARSGTPDLNVFISNPVIYAILIPNRF